MQSRMLPPLAARPPPRTPTPIAQAHPQPPSLALAHSPSHHRPDLLQPFHVLSHISGATTQLLHLLNPSNPIRSSRASLVTCPSCKCPPMYTCPPRVGCTINPPHLALSLPLSPSPMLFKHLHLPRSRSTPASFPPVLNRPVPTYFPRYYIPQMVNRCVLVLNFALSRLYPNVSD